MGKRIMMKIVLVLLAFAAIDAHMTEPNTYELSVPAPPGEDDALALVDEGAGAVTKYRVTWQTKADECANADPRSGQCQNVKSTNEKYASNGSFKLTVTGKEAQQKPSCSATPVRLSSPTGFTREGKVWC